MYPASYTEAPLLWDPSLPDLSEDDYSSYDDDQQQHGKAHRSPTATAAAEASPAAAGATAFTPLHAHQQQSSYTIASTAASTGTMPDPAVIGKPTTTTSSNNGESSSGHTHEMMIEPLIGSSPPDLSSRSRARKVVSSTLEGHLGQLDGVPSIQPLPPLWRLRTESELHALEEKPTNPSVGRALTSCFKGCFKGLSVQRFLPIIGVVKTYQKQWMCDDITSGLSEGIMAIPMGMSYALLAGMPPVYGLYNGLFFPLIYTFFGTSHHASLGVSAIENLLCAEAVASVIGWDAPMEVRIPVTIAFSVSVGVVMMALRLMKVGLVADFLADPILSGFSTASAFLIGTSQLKHLFGVVYPRTPYTPMTWWYCLTHIGSTNWMALGIGVCGILILVFFKWLNGKYFRKFNLPGQLVIVILFTLLAYLFRLDLPPFNVKTLKEIPQGFPPATLPSFNPTGSTNYFVPLLQEAIPIAVMFYVIHMSISKTVAARLDYKIDSEQELVALSVANTLGSFFQCFPCATSLSRTSVIYSIGGKTILHNVPSVAVVCLTLFAITPLLYYLPYTILASVVLFGVYGMIDFREAYRLFRLGGPDFALWLVCFCVTVGLGAMEGVMMSVILSLLWLLKKTSRPFTALLGQLPGTTVYRNLKRFPTAVEPPGVKIFRFDASLNFSNAAYFEAKIKSIKLDGVHAFIVDASSINDVDATSVRMLQRVVNFFNDRQVALMFANWKGPMRDFLDKAKFYQYVPAERCFLSLHDAVVWAISRNYANSANSLEPETTPVALDLTHKASHISVNILDAASNDASSSLMPSPATSNDTDRARLLTSYVKMMAVASGAGPDALNTTTQTQQQQKAASSSGADEVDAHHEPEEIGGSGSGRKTEQHVVKRSPAGLVAPGSFNHHRTMVTSPSRAISMHSQLLLGNNNGGGANGGELVWDGLSAQSPWVRLVREVNPEGEEKTWGVVGVGYGGGGGGGGGREPPPTTALTNPQTHVHNGQVEYWDGL
ncbi:unnamed protein product [Vitrella brassicaformis CCMP3155]|uniref:STAS domain-containing protein n=2 Tax=Vitrella brassicaformis TaxID=1169539 RepID=A0A0G4EYY6_VITBC|nr:unnamed protein product [Vitrella brassicaformis CCMP3155]|eukprot:CEM04299.1 unnamed protein product [Vitrella brassicaformis CCMP3155]